MQSAMITGFGTTEVVNAEPVLAQPALVQPRIVLPRLLSSSLRPIGRASEPLQAAALILSGPSVEYLSTHVRNESELLSRFPTR